MKTIHCPVCSKEVPVLKNGLVKPHISSRKIQCIWGGQLETHFMTDPFARFEEWMMQSHKSTSCSIEHDDGYGASCWVVRLSSNTGSISVCPGSDGAEMKWQELPAPTGYTAHLGQTAAGPTIYVEQVKGNDVPLECLVQIAMDYAEAKLRPKCG